MNLVKYIKYDHYNTYKDNKQQYGIILRIYHTYLNDITIGIERQKYIHGDTYDVRYNIPNHERHNYIFQKPLYYKKIKVGDKYYRCILIENIIQTRGPYNEI